MTEQSAHLMLATIDCATPGCVGEGKNKGPGGHLYCDACAARTVERRAVATARLYGTSSGRAMQSRAMSEHPSDLHLHELATKLRLELRRLERAVAGRKDAERRVYRARRDALATVAVIIDRVRETADQPRASG